MPSSKRKLATLRSQQTKLRQAIETELESCGRLGQSQSNDDEACIALCDEVKACIRLLQDLSQRFEDITLKVSEAAEDENNEEEYFEEMGSSSMDLTVKTSKAIAKLEVQRERLQQGPSLPNGSEATADLPNVVQRQLETLLEIERLRSQEDNRRRSSYPLNTPQIRLPKIEFPKFTGDVVKWTEFWDSFDTAVHRNTELQPIEKLTYLRSKLGAEALGAIEGLQTTNDNYDVAIQLLKSRFGNTQVQITTHYARMMDLTAAPNVTPKIRLLHDEIEKHLRCLEALGEDVSHRHFISLIMAKLPWQVVAKLEETKDEESVWTVELLRKKLRAHLNARETADRQCSDQNQLLSHSERKQVSLRSEHFKRSTTDALFAGNREINQLGNGSINCVFCAGNHWSDECRRYASLEARKIAAKGKCYICLSDKHLLRNCSKHTRPCWHCKRIGNHHRSLCPEKFANQRESVAVASDQQNGGDTDNLPNHTDTVDDVLLASGEKVLLQTAMCTMKNKDGEDQLQTRMLLDSGSHRSYISEKLAKKLRINSQKTEIISIVTFGAEKSKTIQTKVAEIVIVLKDGSEKNICVNVVPMITGSISRSPVKIEKSDFLWKALPLADTFPTAAETHSIDCLIGSDYYLELITAERIEIRNGLYLLGSRLGWILTGRTSGHGEKNDVAMLITSSVNQAIPQLQEYQALDQCLPVKPNLEDFWNLDTIGIKDGSEVTDDQRAHDNFLRTVQFEDGRYYVRWPWRDECPDIPENYELSHGRFKSTVRRLSRNNELLRKYNEIIEDQEKKGVIERVHDCNVAKKTARHYIPHHPVVTPTKATTKVRIVYDASAKTKETNKSLNECLLRGPVILQNLCGLLLRFRLYKIALIADIEKAFLQVGLQEVDRDVTRFLWLKDIHSPPSEDNIEVFRFCRVPFGVISSPFLLGATVTHHLKLCEAPLARKICKNLYVDNVVTGCSNLTEALHLYKESKKLFERASMNLREWCSNSKKFMDQLPPEDATTGVYVKVLGLKWEVALDKLLLSKSVEDIERGSISKREVVKRMAAIFDPLGLFTPVTLQVKLFVQELWEINADWDAPLTESYWGRWKIIAEELRKLSAVKVNRWIPVDRTTESRLLCFCDASQNAYATAIYLQFKTKYSWTTRLLFARSRISSKKRMTIPRLELLGVWIGVRCMQFVESEIDIKISQRILWTDSKCVLHWLKSKRPLSVFVENRLTEIRKHKNIVFRYITSSDNPADIGTKVQTVQNFLNSSLWWEGPSWLIEDISDWPSWNFEDISKVELESVVQEARGSKILFEASLSSNDNHQCETQMAIDETRFSSANRLLRVTAWILRFLRLLGVSLSKFGLPDKTSTIDEKTLTADELRISKLLWERHIQSVHYGGVITAISLGTPNNLQRQLGLYLDESKVIRCHGRYQNAALDEHCKSPKLLPRKSHFTSLVVDQVHKKLLHAGVSHTLSSIRSEYWIPQGRAEVRRIISNCMVCRKFDGGPFKPPPMPPWPSFRLNPSPPFSYTGLDYFGPLYIKDKTGQQSKVWVCLFTCMCVRALHLELVDDLSGEQFLLCFRRFIARRGCPIQLISDNAPQFKSNNSAMNRLWGHTVKNEEVQSFVSSQGITWKFIPEFAPWMGGFYERLVGLVKQGLRKTVGKLCLSQAHLLTILSEVELMVNSRPLAYVGDDIASGFAITPHLFLSLNPRRHPPVDDDQPTDPDYKPKFNSTDSLVKCWQKGQRLLSVFWDAWEKDYLLSLRERQSHNLKRPRVVSTHCPVVGQVVLIKDGRSARGTWRMGLVLELVPSSDGCIRAAKLRVTSSSKEIVRPIKNLYPIEYFHNYEGSNSADQTNRDTSIDTSQQSDKGADVRKTNRKAAIAAKANIKAWAKDLLDV